jgi:two-component system OmpR family response regulator
MRVLVVEDDIRLADVLFAGLTAEGFDVDVVHDGFDGYWQAREGAHDVIVLDVLLPSINGYAVAERLRGEEVWTPILMLTAKDGEYDEADGLDVGADDYLRKPFSFVVLSQGGLSLDPESGDCTVDGKPVALQPRERALLEVLLRSPDRALSKDRLLNAVWGVESVADTNLVEVYVSYLRRKIGATRIETVRSLGYRLVDPDA